MAAKIIIALEMPSPEKSKAARPSAACSPEEKIRKSIELIESGYCSDTEWLMLNKLYKSLKQKKQTPRVKNAMAMIKPVLAKYGYHDVSTED